MRQYVRTTAAAVVLGLGLSAARPAAAATFVSLKSQPGDFVGGGVERTLTPADGEFYGGTNGVPGGGQVGLTIAGPDTRVQIDFAAPVAKALASGPYENAMRFGFSWRHPGLDVSIGSSGCNTISGRFVIFELAIDSGGRLTRLAANFEQHCDGAAAALFGIVRFDSDIPADAPEPTPVPATPTPTSYDVFFLYQSEPGDFVGGGVTDFISDGDALFDVDRNGDGVFVNISADDFWTARFETPRGVPFGPGTYENAKSFFDRKRDDPALDVSGLRGGCDHITGRFVVLEVVYGKVDAVEKLAVDFEQRCGDASAPALRGSIRYHSTVPIGTPQPTSTATGTASATPTETNTPREPLTPTPSLSPTITLTPSLTATATRTPIPTATRTSAPCPEIDLGSQVPTSALPLLGEASSHRGPCSANHNFAHTFRFTAPQDGRYVFDALSSQDTVLFARAPTCDGSELSCNDDAGPSRLRISLAAGSEIVVFIGLSTPFGFAGLSVTRDDETVCAGDCGGDSQVGIEDLILLVDIALGGADPHACAFGVPSGASADISLLIEAVNRALNGCAR